ncbi:thiolase family protein [Granulosicoccaceae sp. 1_MG-2023]|nr:thiolase family protein [Granulosicoccaceae sp. 1_MG-2023]
MNPCYIAAARRTAVVPAGGAFSLCEVYDLGATVIKALLSELALEAEQVDLVIAGNALYGGGNPARMAALAAGLPVSCPAMTLDTQCAGGLDALHMGRALIGSGQARVVIAGGLESCSLAPRRQHRPRSPAQAPQFYTRPAFSPDAADDPDPAVAAHAVAKAYALSRADQARFACDSHRKARAAQARLRAEIVSFNGVSDDAFTRVLSEMLCARAPLLAGEDEFAISSACTAVSADAAAFVVLMSEAALARVSSDASPVRIAGTAQAAVRNAAMPLAPVTASRAVLEQAGLAITDMAVAEVMEAYAAQAMACIRDTGLPPAQLNRGGGALARGHPIGASGAVNAVRLFHELQTEAPASYGLATIAAAGGLGSALIGQRQ